MARLLGVVGIDRGSANSTVRMEFAVLKDDGTALFRQTATYDTSYALDVPLDAVPRIRLRVRLAGFQVHPYEKDARAVWADLRFVPK
jgi:hypothetical protein